MINFVGTGSEQCGWRPGLIFQNNTGNKFSPNIIALPLTSHIKKESMPTHVVLYSYDTGLCKDSMVLCENPQRFSKDKLGKYITTLSHKYMSQVAVASLLSTSAIAFLTKDQLLEAWENANVLNQTRFNA